MPPVPVVQAYLPIARNMDDDKEVAVTHTLDLRIAEYFWRVDGINIIPRKEG